MALVEEVAQLCQLMAIPFKEVLQELHISPGEVDGGGPKSVSEQTLNQLKHRARELEEEKMRRTNKVSLHCRVWLAGTCPKLTHDSPASISVAKLQVLFSYYLYEFAYKRESKLDLALMTSGLLLPTAG